MPNNQVDTHTYTQTALPEPLIDLLNSTRLAVLESALQSIFAGLGLAYQGPKLSHPKIESSFKSSYSCTAVAAPHTSEDLHSYFSNNQAITTQ